MLITECLCGAYFFDFKEIDNQLIAFCDCGIGHQVTDVPRVEYEAQYSGSYHQSDSRHAECTPYLQRYPHDFSIARVRWKRYAEILGGVGFIKTALDVGAANGAFVDYLISEGIDAIGIDPDPMMTRADIRCGRIIDCGGEFDLITYHDVLEHIVTPARELASAAKRLSHRGVLVVDVPYVFDGKGDHHFKREHLWYFNKSGLFDLLALAGLDMFHLDAPIPGKIVAYARACV